MRQQSLRYLRITFIAWAAFVLSGSLSPLDAESPTPDSVKPVNGRVYTLASVRAAPNLICRLSVPGSPDETVHELTVYADPDGYARFYAVKAAPSASVRQIMLACRDSAGHTSEFAADLTSPKTFAGRPYHASGAQRLLRPPLIGDPASRSVTDLIAAGYGMRPDPSRGHAAYERWLASARLTGWMSPDKRPSEIRSHTITPTTNPWWTGTVLKGSPDYVFVEGTFKVPAAIPGAFGTTSTGISVWTGLGGYGGSGLIQAGVDIATTPHAATYSTFREYCCGDPDSNGYSGDFNPAPGDTIYSQNWYCDEKGNPDTGGGYGCSFLHDLTTGQVLNCSLAGSKQCWSVKALPLCSVSQVPNCMVIGQTAEFIVENQSPQILASSTAFTPFTPALIITGSALPSAANASTQTVTSDPAVALLADFTNTTSHLDVSVLPPDQTKFTVSGTVPSPAVMWITPTTGGCDAVLAVTIHGTNLSGATTKVSAGGTQLAISNVSSTSITAAVPATLAPGVYEIVVETPSGNSRQNPPQTDLLNIGPIITGLSPDHGAIAGGTAVTLTGTCFNTSGASVTKVYFGGTEGSLGFDQCVSHTQCVVFSPRADGAKQVDLVLAFQGGKSAAAAKFTYNGPFITSLTPNHGPVTGGTDVLIGGGGFPPYTGVPNNLAVTFGNVQTGALCLGSSVGETTSCGLTTPPASAPGPVQVIGTAYGSQSAPSQASSFTYDPYPEIIKFVLPASGIVAQAGVFLNGNAPAGGAAVTIASSDPATVAADPAAVTIPAGQQWGPVTLVTNPSPVAKHITLTASYQGSVMTASEDVPASPPLMISAASQSVPFNGTDSIQVAVNAPAPTGGAVIEISADDPTDLGLNNSTKVTIPAGQYTANLLITGRYAGTGKTNDRGKWIDLMARYQESSAKTAVWVSPPTHPGKPCAPLCPKGYYQAPDGCGCQKGLPQ